MSITFVQGVSLGQGVGYPLSATLASNVTLGNRIIVFFAHNYAGCPPSVSDNLGNTYTFHGTQLRGTGPTANFCEVFSAPVTTGGACTITAAAGCGVMEAGFALEYSGLASIPYDGENGALNSTATQSSGSITTTADGDLILGLFVGSAGGATWTSSGGATALFTLGGIGAMLQSQIQTTAGAIASTAAGAGAYPWASFPADAFVTAFQAASSSLVEDDSPWAEPMMFPDQSLVTVW